MFYHKENNLNSSLVPIIFLYNKSYRKNSVVGVKVLIALDILVFLYA